MYLNKLKGPWVSLNKSKLALMNLNSSDEPE